MAAVIELESVQKHFGDLAALRGISASIASGRLTGLVGPDGSGKTTLMRLIAALMQPDQGHIRVAGCDTVEAPQQVHETIGYMPQRFGLYEDLSVIENLQLYAELKGLTAATRDQTFAQLLHFTRLGEFVARRAGKLSGGMKQKLGLACALIGEPRVLLLDEPSVGVDPISRRELWQMVQELAGEGMVVVWSTSYLDEAERCEHVLLLNAGELIFQGAPAELTDRLRGRSCRISGITGDRRALLTEVLDRPDVRDGVIQGESLRVVLASADQLPTLQQAVATAAERVETVPPRFEDAFIDMLGGRPGGRSAIAERMDPVEGDRAVMVECRNLTKRFGSFTATDRVSFAVQRGEVFGLLGPNGAGKSTTFRMLCGLLRPSEGSAVVAGYDLGRSPGAAKLHLGYMAQKFSLYGLLSVRQNLEFFSGAYGLRGRIRHERIEEMIEVFNLGHYLHQSPDELPLGFKQRLALSCSLMHRPSVLFLDEPTSGVDPVTRREFWVHISGLVTKGVSVLVTTHFMDEAEYCDRVALINRSRMIALDRPDALKASVADSELPEPTMEDAFVRLVERYEADTTRDAAA